MILTDETKLRLFNSLGANWPSAFPAKVVCRVLKLQDLGALCRTLRLSREAVSQHLKRGNLPGPDVRWKRRGYWSDAAVRECVRLIDERGWFRAGQKFTDAQRDEIYRLWSGGKSQWDIADLFGVSQTLISRVVRGRRANRTHPATPVVFPELPDGVTIIPWQG